MQTLPPPFTEFYVNLSVALCRFRYHQTSHTGCGHRGGGRCCLLKLLVSMVQKKRMTGMSSHYRYDYYFQALGFCLLKSQDQVLKSKGEVNLGSHLVCVPGSSSSVSPTRTTHSTLKEHSQGGARADWQLEVIYLWECLDIWCLILGQDKSNGIYNVLLGFLTTKKKHELCGDAGVPNIKVRVILQSVQFSSVAQSCLTLQLHGLQHIRPPCLPPTPGIYSNSCPLIWWCHPTISSSVVPFSSCLQSFPASGSFQMSQLFASGGQSVGVSASASVLPMIIQDWFPLGWTGWIFLQSKGLSRVFSNTTVQKHQFFGIQLTL